MHSRNSGVALADDDSRWAFSRKLRPQPRWKHADPAVRAAAVYDLGPDDGEALRALAREDADARVRRAAVKRIDDVGVLADIARTDPDEDVRAEAIRGLAGSGRRSRRDRAGDRRVRQLLSLGRTREVVVVARENRDPAMRAAIVELIDEPKALGSMSRHAQDAQTRLRALARLTDSRGLLNVALKLEHTDTAVAALERIERAEACRHRQRARATRWPAAPGRRCVRSKRRRSRPPRGAAA